MARLGPSSLGEGQEPVYKSVPNSFHTEIFQSKETADVAGVDLADSPLSVVVLQQVIAQQTDAGPRGSVDRLSQRPHARPRRRGLFHIVLHG